MTTPPDSDAASGGATGETESTPVARPAREGGFARPPESVREYYAHWWQRVRAGDLGSLPIIVGLVLIAVIFGILDDTFFTARNFTNLLLQMAAVAAQAASEDAKPSLLPIGLGDQGSNYNFDFQDALIWIAVLDGDPESLTKEVFGPKIQAALDASGAPCWAPDADSGGAACQVGGLPTE